MFAPWLLPFASKKTLETMSDSMIRKRLFRQLDVEEENMRAGTTSGLHLGELFRSFRKAWGGQQKTSHRKAPIRYL